MKDIDGIKLLVGHRVAVQSVQYKELEIKTVLGFTDKKVIVGNPGDNLKVARKVDPWRIAAVYYIREILKSWDTRATFDRSYT